MLTNRKRKPQIISASYRTDIPAFYGEWFIERVREKYVRYKNPYGPQIVGLSLAPEDVIAIVFWTKNCIPFMRYLDELDQSGLDYYFQYSINGQLKCFEERVPRASMAIENFHKLSARLGTNGAKRNIWRYDPIIFSNNTQKDFHVKTFADIASALEGSTERCYISFLDLYTKTQKNMGKLPDGLYLEDPPLEQKNILAIELADIAARHGITVYTCAEDFAVGGIIRKGSCVDAELIAELFPHKSFVIRESLNRNKCGCSDHRDIGAYDTCPHGCIYCYAVRNRVLALQNFQNHETKADALLPIKGGNVPIEDPITLHSRQPQIGETEDMFQE